MMEKYTDADYIRGISEHDSQIIRKIYADCFPMVRKMVQKYGGDPDKAKDIFQDTILMIYHKAQAGNLTLICKFSTYFYGVSKKLWLMEIKANKRYTNHNEASMDVVEEPDCLAEFKKSILAVFHKHFNELSSDCRKILRMHFNKATTDEIQSIMGYKNRHHAIDRKYRCKRSLLKRIMNDPSCKNIQNEYAG